MQDFRKPVAQVVLIIAEWSASRRRQTKWRLSSKLPVPLVS
ncbi:MAG: hypothetical protein JWR15_288, partial [Prosthecobacter sp.]|nr:hypothetical protein [Prosthecobacter sp.]